MPLAAGACRTPTPPAPAASEVSGIQWIRVSSTWTTKPSARATARTCRPLRHQMGVPVNRVSVPPTRL